MGVAPHPDRPSGAGPLEGEQLLDPLGVAQRLDEDEQVTAARDGADEHVGRAQPEPVEDGPVVLAAHLDLGGAVEAAEQHVGATALQAHDVDGQRTTRGHPVSGAPAGLGQTRPDPGDRVELVLLDEATEALRPSPVHVPGDATGRPPESVEGGRGKASHGASSRFFVVSGRRT